MAKVFRVLKTIKNNWKKSIFFSAVLAYGSQYAYNEYETRIFMTECCKKVSLYGDTLISSDKKPKKVTVILNPAANKRSATKNFEKYCSPLLHLAGYSVNVLVTECEGGARSLVENLIGETDLLIVAGGDGTLSEVVTGLLRRLKGDTSLTVHLPIGILPLGRTNTIAKQLLHPDDENYIHFLANATITIIQEATTPYPVIKIENLQSKNPEKCVYALNSIEWGAMREAKVTRDSYWYIGKFRDLAPFVFGNKLLNQTIDAELEYSPPCDGCSTCYRKSSPSNNTLSIFSYIASFFTFKSHSVVKDYSKVINPECNIYEKQSIRSLNVSINLNVGPHPSLKINIGPEEILYSDFVKEGYQKFIGKSGGIINYLTKEAKEIILSPHTYEDKWLSIDNEDYEVKPMKLTLIPNSIYLFCPINSNNSYMLQDKTDDKLKLSIENLNRQFEFKRYQ
ncbi:acylglycerol kinase, mitochondrial isoform X2 [Daktulosphaira vitifoliae]|uniref:acylglycerol kinase, mitochondrial isoform X2 n=1 Tax=Daktulosphaira vitifoliae TaxID=58002 RepID=UPI0021AA25D8|nr:acylglycerol kinase, mitochondrial isoform X2 [Daktulosphaira vitifoliae]